jgi:hypothetical protein
MAGDSPLEEILVIHGADEDDPLPLVPPCRSS